MTNKLGVTLESLSAMIYPRGIAQCLLCRGNGYIYYAEDDCCDVQPCDCTYAVEIKR